MNLIHHKSMTPLGVALSPAVEHSGLVAISGQTGKINNIGGVPDSFLDEVNLAFERLEDVLNEAGLSKASVIKTTCFLTDISLFGVFDQAYSEFFNSPYPARSTVGVQLADGLRFEIEAWAVFSDH